MTVMPDQTPSDVIATQVRLLRRRADLTRAQLAEACTRHGGPELTFSALTNIETGRRDPQTGRRRRAVTVDELLVLASALGVTPAALVFPDDRDGAAWFTGRPSAAETTVYDLPVEAVPAHPQRDHKENLVPAPVKLFILRYEQRITARGITVKPEDAEAILSYARNAGMPASGRTEEVVIMHGHLEDLRVNLVPVDAEELADMGFEAEKRLYGG